MGILVAIPLYISGQGSNRFGTLKPESRVLCCSKTHCQQRQQYEQADIIPGKTTLQSSAKCLKQSQWTVWHLVLPTVTSACVRDCNADPQ